MPSDPQQARGVPKDELSHLGDMSFQSVFQACPVGVIVLSLDRLILYTNPTCDNLLAYPPGALKGKHWTDITLAEDVPLQQAALDRFRKPGFFQIRKRYRTFHGEVVWADLYANEILDDEGHPHYFLGVVVPCGEAVAREEALLQTQGRLQQLVENIPGGVARISRDHKVLFVDEVTAHNMGLEREFILGRRLEELGLPDDFLVPFGETLDRTLSDGGVHQVDLTWGKRSYRASFTPEIPILDGGSVLVVVRDTTASVQRRQDQERRLVRAEHLSLASISLAEAGLDVDKVLDVIVKLASQVVGEGSIISVLSDDGLRLDGVALYHPNEAILELGKRAIASTPFRPDGFIFATLRRTNKAVRLLNMPLGFLAEKLLPEHREVIGQLTLKHLLAVPIRIDRQVRGALYVVSSTGRVGYTAEDENLLSSLADRAGLTLAAARLFRENQRQANELRDLNRELEERVFRRTQELKEANLKLQVIASRDPLTDLANRRQLDVTLEREVRRCRRSGQPLALLMVDIDHFKAYNDTYGHQQGDACLQQVAMLLKSCCRRATDLVARYGGEEFVAILADTGPEQALKRAQEMSRLIEASEIPHVASPVSPWVTVSLGVVCGVPAADHGPSWWIGRADEALYESKRAGRNRVTTWHAALIEETASAGSGKEEVL